MASDHVVQGFLRDCEAIHPSTLTRFSCFFVTCHLSSSCSIASSLSLPFHFSNPMSSPPIPPLPYTIPRPLCTGLGRQQKSSTMLFMAAGAEAGPTMEYGEH